MRLSDLNKRLTALCALSLLTYNSICFATASHSLEAGIHCFNSRNYVSALYQLTEAEKENPQDPVVHYYVASTLARLNQSQMAAAEFRVTYDLSPDSSVGRNAKAALAVYGQAPLNQAPINLAIRQALKTQASIKQVARGQISHGEILSQKAASFKAAPLNAPKSSLSRLDPDGDALVQAVKFIHRQTEQSVKEHLDSGNQVMAAVRAPWERQAAEVDKRTQEQVSAMQGTFYQNGVGYYYPLYSPDQIQAIRSQGAQEAATLRGYGQDAGQSAITQAQDKARSTEDSAIGLETQLVEQSVSKDGIRLIPNGTNLYVRNYEIIPTADEDDDSLVPLVATQGKLNLLQSVMTNGQKRNVFIPGTKVKNTVVRLHPGARPTARSSNTRSTK